MHMQIPTETSGSMALDKDRIFLFPLSLDDELHASQAGRYHIDSGNLSTRKSFAQLYDVAPFRNTHWIPRHLERFARKIPGSFIGNTEALLRYNTNFPLFETFGNAVLSLSQDAVPLAQQILNMPKRIVGESGKIKLCFDCLQNDWEEYGTPYIHRSHQIPAVDICWKHGGRLLTCCPFCGCPFEQVESSDLVLAPWKPCLCGHYLPEATFWRPERDAGEVEIDFTRFAHELLVSPSQHLSASVLATLYKKRIVDLGITRKSRIDRQAMIAAIEEHFSIKLLAKIDVAYRTGRNQHWFHMGGEASIFDAPITRHLALAYFLFRDATLFWKAAIATKTELGAQASEAIAPTREKRVPIRNRGRTIYSSESVSETYYTDNINISIEKQELEVLMKQHPKWTIKDMWHECPGLMRKFLRKNADGLSWIKERLNMESVSRKGAHSSCGPNQSDDIHWAQKFKEAAMAEYVSIKLPTKATCNYLMRKAGWKRPNRPDSQKFPLAKKTLEALAESQWHYYARRILWAKLKVGVSSTSRSSIIIPSGIEHHRGCDLLVYFSKVSASCLHEADTIMKILEEHGISRSWGGLPPSPKYYVPGRNYVSKRQIISRYSDDVVTGVSTAS